jgi:hypothetical protein
MMKRREALQALAATAAAPGALAHAATDVTAEITALLRRT